MKATRHYNGKHHFEDSREHRAWKKHFEEEADEWRPHTSVRRARALATDCKWDCTPEAIAAEAERAPLFNVGAIR